MYYLKTLSFDLTEGSLSTSTLPPSHRSSSLFLSPTSTSEEIQFLSFFISRELFNLQLETSSQTGNMSTTSMSTFDPYTQNITILAADGVTPVVISIPDVDSFFYYNTASCISLGAQLGASLIMFIVVIVLTNPSKRRTPIFILNLFSLFLGFLRALLLAIYFVSPWIETYRVLALDFTTVPRSAYATSIAADVIPLCMTLTVNISLVLQAYTVCKNMDGIYRCLITCGSCVVFLLALSFRFAQAVTNSILIMDASTNDSWRWIRTGTLATETISIWWFSIIFTSKLLYVLYIRRRNHWKQWSNVSILTAMGGCTMIIPCEHSNSSFEVVFANFIQLSSPSSSFPTQQSSHKQAP